MSGGSRGSGSGGGGGPETEGDCAGLFEQTILQSPVPDVVESLKKNDVLALELQSDKRAVLARSRSGNVAGSIVTASLAKLIRCLSQGYEFVAVVLEVKGGRCTIEVQAK